MTMALLKSVSDPTATDNQGQTVLHEAAFYGRVTTLTLLLDFDRVHVNPRVRDMFGQTALECAVDQKHEECASILRDHIAAETATRAAAAAEYATSRKASLSRSPLKKKSKPPAAAAAHTAVLSTPATTVTTLPTSLKIPAPAPTASTPAPAVGIDSFVLNEDECEELQLQHIKDAAARALAAAAALDAEGNFEDLVDQAEEDDYDLGIAAAPAGAGIMPVAADFPPPGDAVAYIPSDDEGECSGGGGGGGGNKHDYELATGTPADQYVEVTQAEIFDPPTSFATSRYKKTYRAAPVPSRYMQLLTSLDEMLQAHCTLNGFDPVDGEEFHMALFREATDAAKSVEEMLSKVPAAAQRMWTSAQKFRRMTELCSIINAAIRSDHPMIIDPTVHLVRGINQLCIARRATTFGSSSGAVGGAGGGASQPNDGVLAIKFPADGITYRGATLPEEHLAFYTVGKEYRVPGYVATSFQEKVAKRFARRAWQEAEHSSTGRLPAVLYVVQVDPDGETDEDVLCQNANYIANTLVPGEDEYLFVPYSVFTVTKVELSPNPNYKKPHRIYITAADDSLLEAEDQPLAPWY